MLSSVYRKRMVSAIPFDMSDVRQHKENVLSGVYHFSSSLHIIEDGESIRCGLFCECVLDLLGLAVVLLLYFKNKEMQSKGHIVMTVAFIWSNVSDGVCLIGGPNR